MTTPDSPTGRRVPPAHAPRGQGDGYGRLMDELVERVVVTLLGMQRHSWEQGVASQALLDLGRGDIVLAMAADAVLRQSGRGWLGDLAERGSVNGGANGEAVLWAAEVSGDPAYAAAAARQLGWLTDTGPRAADGTLFHLDGSREVWSDTPWMVAPFLAAAGRVDEAVRQVEGHRRRLHVEATGLYAHKWDEDEQRLVRPAAWGGGNGWVVAGIARMLRIVGEPIDELAAHSREVLDACLAHRRPDGTFGDVVDDPGSFAEVNLAQMLAYAAYVGVADGWLPAQYASTADSLRATAVARVDATGRVTQVASAPHFDRPGCSPEAQAFFLLVHAAAAGRPAA